MVQAQSLSHPDDNLAINVKDDFTRIHGIGPGIERRLHAAGILTYDQLAALQAQEIVAAVGNLVGMSAQRVLDQKWIGQAHQLDAQSRPVETGLAPAPPESRQHYATVTVELLLDEDNRVKRTRATHVQSQAESAWAGWEEHRLEKFFIESAGVKIPQTFEAVESQTAYTEAESETPAPVSVDSENLHQEDLILKALESEYPKNVIRSGQPFRVRLMLDLENASRFRGDTFAYSVNVYAKEMGSVSRQIIGKAEGSLLPVDHVNLDVENMHLSSGVYRIEAFVALSPSRRVKKPGSGLMAMTEGSLLQVY
jgi:hypothetical protein